MPTHTQKRRQRQQHQRLAVCALYVAVRNSLQARDGHGSGNNPQKSLNAAWSAAWSVADLYPQPHTKCVLRGLLNRMPYPGEDREGWLEWWDEIKLTYSLYG